MKYAYIFAARRYTGYKFEVIIHTSAYITDSIDCMHFDTKAECKAWAKSQGAEAFNY